MIKLSFNQIKRFLFQIVVVNCSLFFGFRLYEKLQLYEMHNIYLYEYVMLCSEQ